jgi:hypothetical protein
MNSWNSFYSPISDHDAKPLSTARNHKLST